MFGNSSYTLPAWHARRVDLAELWRQVVDAPDDVGPRLVLADALMELDDPRGELIALQCRGADSTVMLDDKVGAAVERVGELVAQHWDAWLGPLARIAHRQGSHFRDGMLATLEILGDRSVPDDMWDALGAHRELSALRTVRVRNRSDHAGRFLAALSRDPERVEMTEGVVAAVRRRRREWRVRELSCRYWSLDALRSDVAILASLAPQLERFVLETHYTPRDEHEATCERIAEMPVLLPSLRSIVLEDARLSWLRDFDDDRVAALCRRVPILELH
jgi:uncharacterized protein (TIGR02996 family)